MSPTLSIAIATVLLGLASARPSLGKDSKPPVRRIVKRGR